MSTKPLTKSFPVILNLKVNSFRGSYRKGHSAFLIGDKKCPYDPLTTPGKKHYVHWKAGYADAEKGINQLFDGSGKKNKAKLTS